MGTATGAALGVIAFEFLTTFQYPGMGEVLFRFVPIAAGFSAGLVTPKFNRGAPIALLSLLGSLLVLIAAGKEGVLCAALAFPLLLAGLLMAWESGSWLANCSCAATRIELRRPACSCCWLLF